MVCNTLLQNDKIKIKTISIGRNRLEEKGAFSLAKVLEKMKSIENSEIFKMGLF